MTVLTYIYLNDLFLYLAIDTVLHPSGIFKMALSFEFSKSTLEKAPNITAYNEKAFRTDYIFLLV